MATDTEERMVYVDRAGEPQCVEGGAVMRISDEAFRMLEDLRGHLELAIACREVFGGIPVPVKQALLRSMIENHERLAFAHILHSTGISVTGKAVN
jgi:uncharacterized protein YbbK (DUF523 family)